MAAQSTDFIFMVCLLVEKIEVVMKRTGERNKLQGQAAFNCEAGRVILGRRLREPKII
jgi:hypothetical protein